MRDMMPVDKILLTPLEKWRYHRIIPWQLVVHLLLIAVVTFQVCSSNSRVAAFTRRMNVNWHNYLLGDTGVNNDDVAPPMDPKFYLYDVDDILTSMTNVINNYYNIKNNSMTKFNYRAGFESDDKPPIINAPRMTNNVYAGGYDNIFNPAVAPTFDIVSNSYEVNTTFLGPYDIPTHGYDAVRKLLHISDTILLKFSLTSFDLADNLRTCAVWHLTVLYDNNDNGPFTVSFSESVMAGCVGDKPYPASDADFEEFAYFWFPNMMMIIFSILHFVLVIRDVRQDIKWYRKVLLKLERDQAKRGRIAGNITSPRGSGSDADVPEPGSPMHVPDQSILFNVPTANYRDAEKIYSQEERHHRIRMKLVDQFSTRSGSIARHGPAPPKKIKKKKGAKPPLTLNNMVRDQRGILSRKNWKTFYWPVMSHRFFLSLTLANITCFALSIKNFSEGAQYLFLSDTPHSFLAGIAVALAWASLLTWLSSNHGYFIVVKTLSRGLPRVAAFCVGAIPIFMAYAFFGVVYFGDFSGRFGNFVNSAVSLFAILNGDILRESYLELMAYDSVMAQLYLYSFIFFFIYCILAVFIVIMEKSYEVLNMEEESSVPPPPEPETPSASWSISRSFRKLAGNAGGGNDLKLPLLGDEDNSISRGPFTRQRSTTPTLRAQRSDLLIGVPEAGSPVTSTSSKPPALTVGSPKASTALAFVGTPTTQPLLSVANYDSEEDEGRRDLHPVNLSSRFLKTGSPPVDIPPPPPPPPSPPSPKGPLTASQARARLEEALRASHESFLRDALASHVPSSQTQLTEKLSELFTVQRHMFATLSNSVAQVH